MVPERERGPIIETQNERDGADGHRYVLPPFCVMFGFVIRRLVTLLPTLLGITFAVFLMVHLVPGDPAQVMLGERATPESLAVLRQELGLDQPWYVQLGRYLSGLASGDLGRSIKSHTPVVEELVARFPATFELTLASMLLACLIGLTAGVLSATRRNSAWDFAGLAASLAGVSMPIFLVRSDSDSGIFGGPGVVSRGRAIECDDVRRARDGSFRDR